jgi:pyruvate dehydrogenase E1 component
MLEQQQEEFYYLTVTNENYVQASLEPGEHEDVIRGMRLYARYGEETAVVRLLGSGAILREVIAAAQMLDQEWQVSSEVWSVTSFSELARDAREVQRQQLFGGDSQQQSHLLRCLPGSTPIVAASDYVRGYVQLVAPYLQAPYITLGTDGFGRSDTRLALRSFFEVDRHHIVLAALASIDPQAQAKARAKYGIDADADAPWNC